MTTEEPELTQMRMAVAESEVLRLQKANEILDRNLQKLNEEFIEQWNELIETQRREGLMVRLYILEVERRPKKTEEEL